VWVGLAPAKAPFHITLQRFKIPDSAIDSVDGVVKGLEGVAETIKTDRDRHREV
jgi:hypothetical protein